MKDYKPDDWTEYPKPGYMPRLWIVAAGLALWLALGAAIVWWVSR